MTNTITFLDGSALWRRLKNIILLGTFAGLVTATGWSCPKVINESRWWFYDRSLVENSLDKQDYKAADSTFKEASQRSYLPTRLDTITGDYYEKVGQTKKKQLAGEVKKYNYLEAALLLDEFKTQPYFTANDLSELEKQVQSVHPDELVKKAENAEEPFPLYLKASKGYERLIAKGRTEMSANMKTLISKMLENISKKEPTADNPYIEQMDKIEQLNLTYECGQLKGILQAHLNTVKFEDETRESLLNKAFIEANSLPNEDCQAIRAQVIEQYQQMYKAAQKEQKIRLLQFTKQLYLQTGRAENDEKIIEIDSLIKTEQQQHKTEQAGEQK